MPRAVGTCSRGVFCDDRHAHHRRRDHRTRTSRLLDHSAAILPRRRTDVRTDTAPRPNHGRFGGAGWRATGLDAQMNQGLTTAEKVIELLRTIDEARESWDNRANG